MFYCLAPICYFLFIWGLYKISYQFCRLETYMENKKVYAIDTSNKAQFKFYIKYGVVVLVAGWFIANAYNKHPYGFINHLAKVWIMTLPPTVFGIYNCFKKLKTMTDEEIVRDLRETDKTQQG
jgi:hypothetical protein